MKKSEVKEKIKKKFIIGNVYNLRTTKSINGCTQIVKQFILKQKIYTMNGIELAVLIMKQITGPCENIYTLNKKDCKKFHIKFEPGLQVYSMYLNFY